MATNLIDNWVTNPWFQLSGFAMGVIGIAVAILIYVFTRRYKRIWYDARSFTLVERERSTVPGLQVLFEKKPVDALTISKVCVCNSGKDPLRQGDLARLQPLRINVGNKMEILEASIIQTSSKNSGCTIERRARNSYEIGFEFLDPSNGLVVQLAHTGTASEDLSVTGHIVGGRRITRPRPLGFLRRFPAKRIIPKTHRGRRIFVIWLMCLGGFFMIASGWAPRTQLGPRALSKIMPVLLGSLYLVFAWSLYRTRPPKGLERYEDEFQGADFTKTSFRFAEAPQFETREQAARWLIDQAQALASSVHARFKARVVSDKEIDLNLGGFYWLTLGQIQDIIELGRKHDFRISVRGTSPNPFIPDECYKDPERGPT